MNYWVMRDVINGNEEGVTTDVDVSVAFGGEGEGGMRWPRGEGL
jgi:hypothetical protein